LRGKDERSEIRDSRVGAERAVSWVRLAISASMAVRVALDPGTLSPYLDAAWVVLAFAISYAWLAFLKTTRDARRGVTSTWMPWLLSLVSGAFVVATVALTGAGHSPIVPVAITVVISTSIRFDLARSMTVVLWMAATLSAVILWVPQPDLPWDERLVTALWWSWLLVAIALLVGVLSQAADLARRERARAEAETVAEHRRLDEERNLRRRIEAMDEARTDFLRALAHDFRTPILSIEALSAALARRSKDLDPAQQAEMAELVEGHARHLSSMLSEVREVAVTESLGAERRVELSDVYLPEMVRAAASAAGLATTKLETHIDPSLHVIRTDGSKMQRILANLLENAAKHTSSQEVIEVRAARWEGDLLVSVLDRGPGIPPELVQRAFEKFVSFGPERSSGLGMWIVSQFVEALGGTVWVEPRAGGGLIVRARFPLNAAVPSSDAAATAYPETPREPRDREGTTT
jgi:signal transduction histidine kinase